MEVYEKATRMAWWLQGPVALRELLYLRELSILFFSSLGDIGHGED